MPQNYKIAFFKVLWILRDYLSEIVIGGGWVPFLYYHYLISDKSREPLRTLDIDLVVGIDLPVLGGKTIDQLLLEAGLKPKFKSRDIPPVIHYEGIIEDQEVEIEFLTEQRGPKDANVIQVQKGLHAEALRFISILLDHVIELTIDDFKVKRKYVPLKVKVPSPEAYIFHKGLIYRRRRNKFKEAKDLYYIFDILINCPELREQIIEGLKRLSGIYSSWFSRFLNNLKSDFSDIKAKGIELILTQRPSGTLPHLTKEQFKQYALGTFQEFIEELSAF